MFLREAEENPDLYPYIDDTDMYFYSDEELYQELDELRELYEKSLSFVETKEQAKNVTKVINDYINDLYELKNEFLSTNDFEPIGYHVFENNFKCLYFEVDDFKFHLPFSKYLGQNIPYPFLGELDNIESKVPSQDLPSLRNAIQNIENSIKNKENIYLEDFDLSLPDEDDSLEEDYDEEEF